MCIRDSLGPAFHTRCRCSLAFSSPAFSESGRCGPVVAMRCHLHCPSIVDEESSRRRRRRRHSTAGWARSSNSSGQRPAATIISADCNHRPTRFRATYDRDTPVSLIPLARLDHLRRHQNADAQPSPAGHTRKKAFK